MGEKKGFSNGFCAMMSINDPQPLEDRDSGFELHRQRFGIESSYRRMNQLCARTSISNPAVRLLLMDLAFVWCSLCISLRQTLSATLK
jgi:hypothetical protein